MGSLGKDRVRLVDTRDEVASERSHGGMSRGATENQDKMWS